MITKREEEQFQCEMGFVPVNKDVDRWRLLDIFNVKFLRDWTRVENLGLFDFHSERIGRERWIWFLGWGEWKRVVGWERETILCFWVLVI